MSLDALIKRYFTFIALAAVGLIAFFQASAATQLLGAAIEAGTDLLAGAATSDPKAPLPKTRAARTAKAIVKRNIFDSTVGPLDVVPLSSSDLPESVGAAPKDPEIDYSDPIRAPRCTGAAVRIVTEADDPEWSFAAIQGDGDKEPALHRVGDKVGPNRIVFIGFNPVERSPAVWMIGGNKLCQSLLFAEQPAPAPPAPSGAVPPPPPPTGPEGAPAVPQEMRDKIKKVSATEFNVDRSVVDQILQNQAVLMRQARIVPEQQDGQVIGVRLFGIRPDTLLGVLGMENGDRLEKINGFNMGSPEKALEAYARLRTASKLTVAVNRRGQPVNLDFNIK